MSYTFIVIAAAIALVVLLLAWRTIKFFVRLALIGVILLLLVGAYWWWQSSANAPTVARPAAATPARRAPR